MEGPLLLPLYILLTYIVYFLTPIIFFNSLIFFHSQWFPAVWLNKEGLQQNIEDMDKLLYKAKVDPDNLIDDIENVLLKLKNHLNDEEMIKDEKIKIIEILSHISKGTDKYKYKKQLINFLEEEDKVIDDLVHKVFYLSLSFSLSLSLILFQSYSHTLSLSHHVRNPSLISVTQSHSISLPFSLSLSLSLFFRYYLKMKY